MMSGGGDPANARVQAFQATMEGGETDQVRLRRFLHWLPADPRCKSCNAPFGLPGSVVSRAMGRRPWAKNPRFCDRCYRFLADNGIAGVEIEVTSLFADVRDSTGLAEAVGPVAFRGLIDRFYRIASEALLATDGLVDKFMGDGVVGLYIPGLSGRDHPTKAVEAARRILARSGEAGLPVGVGVHTGIAFVGAVGAHHEVEDFTALGDPVNATARLASSAAAGEALISRDSAAAAGLDAAGLESRRLELRGRREPMEVVVLKADAHAVIGRGA